MIPTEVENLGPELVELSATAATIHSYRIKNENGYAVFVQFYDNAKADVNVTADTPDLEIQVAANDIEAENNTLHAFANGITARCGTRSALDTDIGRPSRFPLITLQLDAAITGGELPTEDATDGTTLWNDTGAVKVSSAGG